MPKLEIFGSAVGLLPGDSFIARMIVLRELLNQFFPGDKFREILVMKLGAHLVLLAKLEMYLITK